MFSSAPEVSTATSRIKVGGACSVNGSSRSFRLKASNLTRVHQSTGAGKVLTIRSLLWLPGAKVPQEDTGALCSVERCRRVKSELIVLSGWDARGTSTYSKAHTTRTSGVPRASRSAKSVKVSYAPVRCVVDKFQPSSVFAWLAPDTQWDI